MLRIYYLIILLCIFGCRSPRPYIRIVDPDDRECVSGTIDIVADVSGEHITRVEFFVDDRFQSTAMHAPYNTIWETHLLNDSTIHSIVAKVYDRAERVGISSPVWVMVDNTHGKPRNTLHLVSGRINNTELEVSDPSIVVHPGDNITGEVLIRADNVGDPHWGAPLGGTPSWGDHIMNYWETDIWLPGGVSEYEIDIFLQAPENTGSCYIFLAWAHETDCSHVMALSYWRYKGSPEWHDGYDIADWTDIQAQMAIDSGYVRSMYRYDDIGYGIKYVAATAIRVQVEE